MKHAWLISAGLAAGAIGYMAGRASGAQSRLLTSGGAYDYAGSDNDTDTYSTPPSAAVLSPEGGWVNFRGMTVTALPLIDTRTGLYARLKYDDSLAVAQAMGAQILDEDDLTAIHEGAKTGESIEIDPFINLPLQGQAPKQNPGESGDAYAGRVMAPMASLHWAKIHDKAVWDYLAKAGYRGDRPVSNLGKYWLPGGYNYGWWRKGATGRDKHQNEMVQSKGGVHIDANGRNTHIDYSQLTMLKKPTGLGAVKGWFS